MTSDSTTPQELPFPDADAPRAPTFGASAAAPFVADIRQFATVAHLAAYLNTLPPPGWRPIGTTIHNTYRPLPSQWAGRPSMDSMVTTYKAKGWDRGPHFYLCVGARAPIHDGIWQMTPPSVPGIHAGACNAQHFGIEVVGDFQATQPTVAQQQLLLDVLMILHRWARIGPALNAHRDCMAGRTCPGDQLYARMPQLRVQLARALPLPPLPPTITADAAIVAPARCTTAQAAAAILAHPHGEYTNPDVGAILAAYWRVCGPVGVDPCLCVAQLIHETGNLMSFWASRPQRNPAGLGVTGQTSIRKPPAGVLHWAWNDATDVRRWEYGLSFASWVDDAIPAHVGRLLAYAIRPTDRTAAQQALITRALGYRSLPLAYQGAAPTLRGLAGRWAVPGADYPTRIAVIAERLRTTEAR